jgi:site-specific DNA-methyltransferase (cytosine-N4-specific)
MLTDEGDTVFDPFAGSCVTGEVAERLNRKWICAELVETYLDGALGRFVRPAQLMRPSPDDDNAYYRVPRPGLLWNGHQEDSLPKDGGKKRPLSVGTGKKRLASTKKRNRDKRNDRHLTNAKMALIAAS